MTSFHRNPLERRTVLRGLGACLSLPLLEAMFPSSLRAAPSQYRPLAQSLGRHPRAIFCYVPNGVNILDWMPKGTGSDFELSPTLEVLAAHRRLRLDDVIKLDERPRRLARQRPCRRVVDRGREGARAGSAGRRRLLQTSRLQ